MTKVLCETFCKTVQSARFQLLSFLPLTFSQLISSVHSPIDSYSTIATQLTVYYSSFKFTSHISTSEKMQVSSKLSLLSLYTLLILLVHTGLVLTHTRLKLAFTLKLIVSFLSLSFFSPSPLHPRLTLKGILSYAYEEVRSWKR